MARLSALDTSFLRVETPAAHMHVGWLSHLDLPAGADRLDVRRLVTTIGTRLHLAPRFRQIVVPTPLGLGEPSWEDDPRFDLGRHVFVAADEDPVGHARLRRLTDEFLSQPLSRDRPLWSLLLVPRLAGGGAALVGKVHHAMVDGIAAVELGMLLFDVEPSPLPQQAPEWNPEPMKGAARRVLTAAADTAGSRVRAAGTVVRRAASPRDGARAAESGGRAALALAGDVLNPAPPSSLNPSIGPQRTLLTQRLELSDLNAIKQAYGVKLNDVVLTIVAGALRQLALVRGEEPVDLRVMVPVSTRVDGESGGNRITFCFAKLPLSAPSPLERLRRVRSATQQMKSGDRIAGSELLLRSIGQLPSQLQASAARWAASPRLYNLTVSNVPGPTIPMYAAGARVASVFPVIPLSEGHALSFGALSYEGGMHFTAYADPFALREAVELPNLLSMALVDLMDANRRRKPALGPRRLSAVRDQRVRALIRS
ncbi:MAG: wax ester/triacylglycerol synthase family O-acyltransferase [Thermoleophilaceae bacterium]